MPMAFITDTNVGANAVVDLMLDGDQGPMNLRFVKRPSKVTYACDANAAASAELEVFSGGRQVVERSAVDGGGTAGTMPNLRDKGISFFSAAGEILAFRLRETAGAGTVDIGLVIDVTPIA